MTILLTGCMGFIGSNLTGKLLLAGHRVIGVDNLSNPSIGPTDRMKAEAGEAWANFKFFKEDIRNYDGIYSIMMHERVNAVVHLAAIGSVPFSFSQPIDFYEVNCAGFATVLQTARDCGIRRVVFASSSSVYGNAPDATRVEGLEGYPTSPYAISKVQNEMHARVWGLVNKMELIGLRFFNVYGPGQRFDSKFSAVIPQWINAQKIRVCGNTVRDFTYVDDVCMAVRLSLEGAGHGFVVNVGAGYGTSLRELSEMISDGREIESAPMRMGDVEQSVACTKYAKERLGFVAQTTLAEGLNKTKAYYEGIRRGR